MIPLRQVLTVSRHGQHGWGKLSAASVVALAILGLQGRGALVVAADGRRGERLGALRAATRHAEPRTYTDLLDMSDDELARVDIALVNLLCAEGLPGSEKLDKRAVLGKLDRWAEQVQAETDRHWIKFHRDPGDYENSEAYFRMLVLISVLQLDLGVRYEPKRIRDPDFRDSRELFIHGMVTGTKGGTCVSMPPLYAAVGRRLGYPLKLVLAKEHVFCRWDGDGERLNVEGSSVGLNTYDDEHYRTWPERVSGEEIARGEFLKSLTPREELADFLASRGHCLHDNGRLEEAREAYAAARAVMPQSRAYRGFLRMTELELARRRVLNTRARPRAGE